MTADVLASHVVESPLGPLLVVVSERGVAAVRFLDDEPPDLARRALGDELGETVVSDDHPMAHRARRQLSAYFAGRRRAFTLPLDPRGTPFQRRVWEALAHIPWGETESYADVARATGQPTATRAVAQACARNRLPILVPCHRVVASDGGLGGYSGGLDRKRRLLALERSQRPNLPLFSVANRREEDTDRREAHARLEDALPVGLRRWLDRRSGRTTEAPPAMEPEQWLADAVAAVGASHLAELADVLAARAAETDDAMLRDVTEEALAMAAAHLLERPPPPEALRPLLRAALTMGSRWYEVLGRRVLARRRLSRELLQTLEDFFVAVMDERLACPPISRERTVDLWIELRRRLGDEAWLPDRAEDPSDVLFRAGLWHEAALSAEDRLAAAEGSRTDLLARLVDAYEHLGDLEMARDRLLALLAEEETPERLQRLRRFEDRLRADE